MMKELRVNMKTKTVAEHEVKDDYKEFGGRGLIAKVMLTEVPPTCDPLAAENKLIICTGMLAGTNIPMAHRLSVGGKSPLTGGIKEANSGGTAAWYMARHGIKMIVLEDMPDTGNWHLLHIKNDSTAELVPADEYAGMNNYELMEKLTTRYGEGISVISIGGAGERQYRNSTLQITDYSTGQPSRAAARGGLGAVMGSKRLKAIVLEKSDMRPEPFPYADKERFEKGRKRFLEKVKTNPISIPLMEVGTASTMNVTGLTGILPVRNFNGGIFDKLESVSAEAFMQRLAVGGGGNNEACQPGCTIKCSNRVNKENGEYLTSGFEYETIALCGPNCDIADLDVIARIDRMCDEFGLDTMETGCTIAVCMEAGKIPWGDGEAAIGLIQEIIDGTDFGQLLSQGTAAAGQALGVKRIPTVKGQALAAYDPRNLKGIGVTYATSPMGGDHTAGLTLLGGMDHTRKTAQVGLSKLLQAISAVADCAMCLFGWFSAYDADVAPDLFGGAYEGEWDNMRVFTIGVQALMMERAFNAQAGFTEKDDRLPEFFYTERSTATGTVFDISDEELAEVFNFV